MCSSAETHFCAVLQVEGFSNSVPFHLLLKFPQMNTRTSCTLMGQQLSSTKFRLDSKAKFSLLHSKTRSGIDCTGCGQTLLMNNT